MMTWTTTASSSSWSQTLRPKTVKHRSFLLIAENFICFTDFLELFFSPRILILVWMIFQCHLSVPFLYFLLGCISFNPKYVVIVLSHNPTFVLLMLLPVLSVCATVQLFCCSSCQTADFDNLPDTSLLHNVCC